MSSMTSSSRAVRRLLPESSTSQWSERGKDQVRGEIVLTLPARHERSDDEPGCKPTVPDRPRRNTDNLHVRSTNKEAKPLLSGDADISDSQPVRGARGLTGN
jgi:hypothetical protein